MVLKTGNQIKNGFPKKIKQLLEKLGDFVSVSTCFQKAVFYTAVCPKLSRVEDRENRDSVKKTQRILGWRAIVAF